MSVTTSTARDAPQKRLHPEHAPAPGKPQRQTQRAGGQQAVRLRGRIPLSILILPPLVLAMILATSWYVSTAYGYANPLILPGPADVFASLYDGMTSGVYLSNTLVTVKESVVGFMAALAIALPFGYGLAKSRLFNLTFHPYLVIGQAIPAIIIAPVLELWIGYGWVTNMWICVLVVLFPLVMNTILGIQTIDQALIDAARVEGA